MRVPSQGHPVHRDWFGLAAFRPGPRFTRDGAVLYLLDEVGSTNDFLRGRGGRAEGRRCVWDGWGWVAAEQQMLDPLRSPAIGTVVVARRQSAGRGRQGRVWQDCGGLHMSVVVPPHRAVIDHGFPVWLGLITALVLRENHYLDARLKWPNDIVVGRQKLGGILLERSGSGDEVLVVAGLGLNLGTERGAFPPDLQQVATSVLIESGRLLRPGEVAAGILQRVEAELDRFQDTGWDPFRPALALLDGLLGQWVRLRVRGQEITGRAVGIDDWGRLLIQPGEDGASPLVLSAGDVHLLEDDGDVEAQEGGHARPAR